MYTHASLTRAALVVAGTLLCGAPARAGDLIEIPIRWCALKGSPAVADPPSVDGSGDTDTVLWRRGERASDRIWLNQGTQITFRSPVTDEIVKSSSFRVIDDPKVDDPNLPGDEAPGDPGDILDPRDPANSKQEWEDAKAACVKAWSDAFPGSAALRGPLAVNVGRLVRMDGTAGNQGGYGGNAGVPLSGQCKNPPTDTAGAIGHLVITDYTFLKAFDADEEILAHELGHTLGLEHGNGLDDDGDGPFDQKCDTDEVDAADKPQSLMTPMSPATLITALQKTRSREFAKVYGTAQKDPPAALEPLDTIADARPDTLRDVSDRSIDITEILIATHTPSQTTLFAHQLIDLLPEVPDHQFLVFADLDDDATTGGAPADLALGVPTDFQGAELVTRVIAIDADGLAVIPTVWKFVSGSWMEISDPSISAELNFSVAGEDRLPEFAVVTIRFSNAVRGPVADSVRGQAFAQSPLPEPPGPSLAQADPAPFDQAPAGGVDFRMFLVPPTFPAALVTPFMARPGQAVTVEANGLFANGMVKVFLGDQMVGVGNSDGAGNVVLNIVVPFGAGLGERLVTVGSVGTALTGDTTLVVDGTPLVPTPVAIDVKPGSCPNPFNVKDKGKVPVAILGSATLDVSQLDPGLVRLEGVAPLSSVIADVATPFLPISGRTGALDCTTAGADGFPDLVFHFAAQALRAALGAVANKQVRVLELTGNFDPALGGAPIVGEDVVITLVK